MAAILSFAHFQTGFADICLGSDLFINFANPADVNTRGEATWWPDNKLGLNSQGLGYDGMPKDDIPGRIETKPFAVGLSWRPTSEAGISLTITSAQDQDKNDIWIANGQVYARYSPDMKHWSTWQPLPLQLENQSKNPRIAVFTGAVGVPIIERQAYENWLHEYAKLNLPSKYDEEAAVKWIVTKDPHFFEKNLSFVGYIQLLFENYFPANQRIARFDAMIWVGMSGFNCPDEAYLGNERRNLPWRFKAE